MNEFILSVVTVCYNSENTIERTLDSVKKALINHEEEVEYVIIDGDSKDHTLEYIHKCLDGASIHFQLISEKDNGIYDAMNKAAKVAHGEFLIYINSDDVLKNDILDKVIPVLEKNKTIGCLCTDVEMVRILDDKEYSYIWRVGDFKYLKYDIQSSHQGMYMNRNTINKLGGFDVNFKIAADWDMIYRIYNSEYEVNSLHEVSSDMYEGGASFKRQSREKHNIRKKNNMYKIFDFYMLKDYFKDFKGRLGSLVLGKKKFRMTTLKKYKLRHIK